ncbi:cytochrome bc complex cytochrome b subunit [Ornithinimicrobium humiphilum]|uniref:Cytochrome bc1 complex cytochrome b subunit n=1 Tax=Ornithinimicrobium humiphilum TaxID=125288 RepID=A0A543KN54_9MICO|nr:ubiquinol-cytochrome c reductase cytochrome b subunit [Ornithinimicrobium humiphilum]TQM96484.1 menaquinol-cytochrome c reductase cytochrome b subunit precursor [Ornithinimicrobium humiphilum]
MSTTRHVPQGADSVRAGDSVASAPPPPAWSADQGSADAKFPKALGPIDERTGLVKAMRFGLGKVFPDHWSFLLGEIAMYSMVICLITGTFLTFWFVPSMGHVVYDGSFVPLKGVAMSEAYASTLDISFEVKGGLLMRQLHHWAALFFIVGLALHAARVFFTGAFRKPREVNWIIGVVLALLAIVEGFAGYSLPDDLLSGTGIRAMNGFMMSAPVIGTWMTFFIFGGEFPGEAIIPRLFIAHVLLLPAILVGLFVAHLALVVIHKHTQFPGPGRTNDNVVGFPVMPVYAAKAGGFFFVVFGVTALVSALVQINPVWVFGPYDPTQVTAGSQPDFYMWFSDGALRLLPGWLEFTIFDTVWSFNIFLGSLLLLPLVFIIMGAYPFIEAWATGDRREHHLLDRPRNAPVRTAVGLAAISMYLVLALATINDILAIKLQLSINDITIVFRVAFFVLPVIVFFVVKRLCLSLQRHDREKVLHGRETGRIVRTPEGRFFEVHEPLDEFERWELVNHETPRPLELLEGEVDEHGVRRPAVPAGRLRRALSNFFYKDAIPTVTPAELAAAHHHGEHDALDSPEAAAAIAQHGEGVSDIPGAGVSGHVEDDNVGAARDS